MAPELPPIDELLLFLLTEVERVAEMDHAWDAALVATVEDRLFQLAATLRQRSRQAEGA